MTEELPSEQKRGRGRPPGSGRLHAGALPQRTTQRDPQRVQWRARRTLDEIENTGIYYVDPDSIPDGMDYEWKSVTIYGDEQILRDHQIRLARDGAWDPVPAHRHPEMMGKFLDQSNPQQAIIVGGQQLMERPKIYSQQARAEEAAKANAALSGQMLSLGLGEKLGKGFKAMKPQLQYRTDHSLSVPENDEAPLEQA